MNAADVIGWVVDGDYYCPACAPTNTGCETCDEETHPIFGDSETDSFNHCIECEELIPETLTTEGVKWLKAQAEDFLLRGQGRPEIHKMWAEAVRGWFHSDSVIQKWSEVVLGG